MIKVVNARPTAAVAISAQAPYCCSGLRLYLPRRPSAMALRGRLDGSALPLPSSSTAFPTWSTAAGGPSHLRGHPTHNRGCVICTSPLPPLQSGLFACGGFPAEHVLCSTCISTALLKDSRCPICRYDLHETGLILGDSGHTIFPDSRRPSPLQDPLTFSLRHQCQHQRR